MVQIRKFAVWLTHIELGLAGVAVVGSMVLTRFLGVALGVLIFLRFIQWVGHGRWTFRTRIDPFIGVLLLLIPINFLISPLPEKSLPQLLRLGVGLGFFYSLLNWVNVGAGEVRRARLRWLTLGVSGAALFLALFSVISVEWANYKLPFIPPSIYAYTSILVGDTIHPNVLAGSLVIFVPVALGLVFFGGRQLRWWEWLCYGVASLVIPVFLVLAQSRGAILAFGTALGVLLLLRWRWGWLIALLTGIAGGMGIWRIGVEKVLDALLVGATLGGINGRQEIWLRAVYMIQDFPFTGVGMGLFGEVADHLYPFFGVEAGRIAHAHQLFLQVAVDLGIPGFAAWFSILLLTSWAAWQVVQHGRVHGDRWLAGFGAGLLAAQAALVVHGMLDAVTWGMVRPAPLVWAVWGMIIAADLSLKRDG